MPNTPKLLKVGAASALAVLLALTAMGHTSSGRRLWKSMRGGAGESCPFALQADPANRDAARRAGAEQLRGTQHAKAMPALGFAFDQTKRSDVEAWITAHNAKCAVARSSGDLECQLQPMEFSDSEISGLPGTVFFTFDASGLLKKLSVSTSFADAQNAAAVAQEIVKHTAQRVGSEPGITTGEFTAPYLAAGSLRQATAEFRLSDYYARTSVTMLGTGFHLRQTYQTLVD